MWRLIVCLSVGVVSRIEFVNCSGIKDDLYSSITALERVFQTEQIIIENLENYIISSEEKIMNLRSRSAEYKKRAHQNSEILINNTNPIDSFHGVNYLVQNKRNLFYELNEFSGSSFIKNISSFKKTYSFPDVSDLDGVIMALHRIQNVYEMSAKNMSNLLGDEFLSKLSASDCYEIGYWMLFKGSIEYAVQWLKEALHKIPRKMQDNKPFKLPVDEIQILDFLSFAMFHSDNPNDVKEGISYAEQALILEPLNLHVRENMRVYRNHWQNLINQGESQKPAIVVEKLEEKLLKDGCRGLFGKSPTELRPLYCTYQNSNHAFLKLAPFKVDVLNLEPYAAIYHDVIYAKEIHILQVMSTSKLLRATVFDGKQSGGVVADTRTSKFAWFRNDSHPLIHTLNQRISDMTGLSMESAEHLQVMNYGIGGHYDLHADYFLETNVDKMLKEHGNRLATTMFYLSDVEQGGATVFPNIKTVVKPEMGNALFWHNTFYAGTGDPKSRHCACPVITGSKWVANKWIRSFSQEFRRPCKLFNDAVKDISSQIVI